MNNADEQQTDPEKGEGLEDSSALPEKENLIEGALEEEVGVERGPRSNRFSVTKSTVGAEESIEVVFNIQILRGVGLLGIIFALLLGTLLTTYVTEWPVPGEPFDFSQTFIYKTFGFNHTCTMIDFNPSKSVAAVLTIAFNVIPLTMFIVLNYFRIQADYKRGRVAKSLSIFNKVVTPIIAACFICFVLVYVNFPSDTHTFTLHYIPFFFYQCGLVLMEIQHIHYLIDIGKVPFNIPKPFLIAYYWLIIGFWIYYSAFTWSFIAENPILDTSTPSGLAFAKFVMYFFMVISSIVPAIGAFIEARDPEIGIVAAKFTSL